MAAITTNQARTQRAREVENALASVRLEGLEPSDEAIALFQTRPRLRPLLRPEIWSSDTRQLQSRL